MFSTQRVVRKLAAELFYERYSEVSDQLRVYKALSFYSTYKKNHDKMQMFIDALFKYNGFNNWKILFELLKAELSDTNMAVTIVAAIVCTTHRALKENKRGI